MTISIYDINAIADICIILSSFYIFVKWRRLNQRMAWSFVLLGVVSVFSSAANFYGISGDANFLLRIPINVFFTLFLA